MIESVFDAVWAGLALGTVMGWVIQRTQFCPVGAMSDMVLIGDSRRARAWVLAGAVALLGVEGFRLIDLVHPVQAVYLRENSSGILGVVLGGLLLGVGMTFTGGGLVRLAVRAGSGSGKSWVILLMTSFAGGITLFGWGYDVFSSLRLAFPEPFASLLYVPYPAIPETLSGYLSLTEPWQMHTSIVVGVAILGVAWALEDMWFRRSIVDVFGGFAVGIIISIAWVLSERLQGYGEGIRLLPALGVAAANGIAGVGSIPRFAGGLFAGLMLGGAIGALLRGGLQAEHFPNQGDLIRCTTGAVMMGVGGGLAGGCEIGLGISGPATVAPTAILALLAMLAGMRGGAVGSGEASLGSGSCPEVG